MITKAFAPMPVRNVELFRRARAQLQLGAANPQKPVAADPRTASSESKRSAAEPHELCIYRPRSSTWSKARVIVVVVVVVASVPREDGASGYKRADLQSAGTSM
ncbi:unnamed protein product [Sphagnum troendelagicum]|uniref:Uncharacterized protein n=1 Tax=Sphagnum troendelagicum TaxID=128251 RepID=A0ABP0U4B8_9BRYO